MIHYFLKPFKHLYTRSEASMAKLCCTGLQKGRTNIIFSAAITQRINECILIFILPTPAISLFYSAPRTYSLRQYANHIQRISHQHHLHKMQHTLNKICIKSGSIQLAGTHMVHTIHDPSMDVEPRLCEIHHCSVSVPSRERKLMAPSRRPLFNALHGSSITMVKLISYIETLPCQSSLHYFNNI